MTDKTLSVLLDAIVLDPERMGPTPDYVEGVLFLALVLLVESKRPNMGIGDAMRVVLNTQKEVFDRRNEQKGDRLPTDYESDRKSFDVLKELAKDCVEAVRNLPDHKLDESANMRKRSGNPGQ